MDLLDKYFEITLETTNGIEKLRELTLKLAMRGKLVPQIESEPSAKILLNEILKEKQRLLGSKLMKAQKSFSAIDKKDIPYIIPHNWEWVRLENVCTLITDGTHHTPTYLEEGVPFLSVKNLSSGKLDFNGSKYISNSEHFELIKRCHPQQNDILLTKIGTTGIAVTVDTTHDFSIFVSVALLKLVKDKVYPKFIEHLVNSPLVKQYSKEGTEGVGNKNLVLRKIREFIIPLPPLLEQKRIVNKIEQILSLCNHLEKQKENKNNLLSKINKSAINKLIKADNRSILKETTSFINNKFDELYSTQSNVGNLKMAILDLGISGKFTSAFSTANSQKKYPTIPTSEEPFRLPINWIWTKLGNVGETQTGTTPPKNNSENFGEYIPFLGPGDIKNFKIDYSNIGLSTSGLKRARFIAANSILMVCIGGSIGKMAINDRDVTCNQQINTITPYEGIYLKYLSAVLQSTYFQNQLLSEAGGSATPIINKGKWNSIPVPLPPIEMQIEIADIIDRLLRVSESLERSIILASDKQNQILNSVLANI